MDRIPPVRVVIWPHVPFGARPRRRQSNVAIVDRIISSPKARRRQPDLTDAQNEHEPYAVRQLAVRRANCGRRLRRDRRPARRVRPGQGPTARFPATADPAAVVRRGRGSADGGRRRPGHGRPADGQVEAVAGAAAHRAQDGQVNSTRKDLYIVLST